MKKILALLLAVIMVAAMAVGCSNSKTDTPPETQTPTQPVDTTPSTEDVTDEPTDDPTGEVTEPEVELSETEKILTEIITEQPMQFPTMVMPLDLTDTFAVESYTGLKSAEHIKESAFCEAMMGSQAFSLVLVRVDDAANAETVANAMREGINPRKWICVEADDLMVVATGDLVLLAMMDSEYAADATAKSTTDLFANKYGELTVTLTGKE